MRQVARSAHSRYLAWGPDALKTRTAPPGAKGSTRPSILSPVVFTLLVIHRTQEEFEMTGHSVVEVVGSLCKNGVVQVRKVKPSLHVSHHDDPPATPLRAPAVASPLHKVRAIPRSSGAAAATLKAASFHPEEAAPQMHHPARG